MAIRAATYSYVEGDDSAVLITWSGLQQGDEGEPVQRVKYADRSAQVFGTFGAGGSVAIEGSNAGDQYATLNRMQGVAASFTSAGVAQILENTTHIRPKVTGGDGTTDLTVALLIRTNTSISRK